MVANTASGQNMRERKNERKIGDRPHLKKCGLSPILCKNKILSLWDEYENAESREAKLAKALDKLETLLQHIQGRNLGNIDFQFNMNYGKQYTDYDPVTRKLRPIIDTETKKLAEC